ncbi:hypothetical protein IKQ26_00015 [bacterium]|nr:hypothetical protein [bacterium]
MAVNLNLNLLYALYRMDAAKSQSPEGVIEQEDFNEASIQVSGDTVTITESDGDVFTYSLEALAAMNAAAIGQPAADTPAADTPAADTPAADTPAADTPAATTPSSTTPTSATPTSATPTGASNTDSLRTREEVEADLEEVRLKVDDYKKKIRDNKAKIAELQGQLDGIYDSIDKTVAEYIDKAEDIEEEVKEEVKRLTLAEIEKYKNGEYKSKDELYAAIKAGVENIMSASAISNLMTELENVLNQKEAEAQPIIAQINSLQNENTTLENEVESLQQKENALVKELATVAAKEEEEKKAKSCDPIGFTVQEDDGSTYQYDFYIDRDNNGQLTDSSEFLGAQGYAAGGQEAGWSEMAALDTDKDGYVSAQEMIDGNVQVVMTAVDKDGNKVQKNLSIAEAFGVDSDIKVNTRQNALKSNDAAPMNFNEDSGNTLLGNFNVTMNGEQYTGYQTADTFDYLNNNYTFSSGEAENTTQNVIDSGRVVNGASDVQFKYNIENIMQSVRAVVEDDFMKYAEEVSAQQGIAFSKEDKADKTEQTNQNQNNNADVPEELLKLEEELMEFSLAA